MDKALTHDSIPYFRVFVSSPGDVNAERRIAQEVIENLPYRPVFRDRVAFRLVMWDKPGADTPMRATLTPQEAINQGLPMPGESDIVIVVFWSRMGTPFTNERDGRYYQSGTHFELMNALESDRAETVIYRRTEKVIFNADDPQMELKQQQYNRVKAFFDSNIFYRPDGSILRGVNAYESPEDFRRKFETHFEALVVDLLKRVESGQQPIPETPKPEPEQEANITTLEKVEWDLTQSPFPGLRAFKEVDAPIFFGRGYEIDQLVQRLAESRFVAVTGASGSGKSSLVGAGLIPRLRDNAIEGSKDWFITTMTPAETPTKNLISALQNIDGLGLGSKLDRVQRMRGNATLTTDDIITILTLTLEDSKIPHWAEIVVFIDQFEELFTLTPENMREPFIDLIKTLLNSERMRVIVTMRADFYSQATAIPALAELLRDGSFPLAAPQRGALELMIQRPAERAQLDLDDGLVGRILDDTGNQPGNLALMAYALDELYRVSIADARRLTFAAYHAIGGVQGAIGTRAEQVFNAMEGDEATKEAELRRIFQELVDVNADGNATRRRQLYNPTQVPTATRAMIDSLVNARLLTSDNGVLEVSHEALLREWARLTSWIKADERMLRTRRRILTDAQEWKGTEEREDLLYSGETLREALTFANQHVQTGLVVEFLEASQLAQQQRIEAEARRKQELERAFQQAEQAQIDARHQQKQAEASKAEAQRQRRLAEEAEAEAQRQSNEATAQQRQAQDAKQVAEKQKAEAQQERDRAEQQRKRARNAIIAAIVLIVVAVGVGLFAGIQTNSARSAQAEAQSAQIQAGTSQAEAQSAQLQVETQIAALDAIAPGATQGAIWSNWVDSQFTGQSNNEWEPIEHTFDGHEMVYVPAGCYEMGGDPDAFYPSGEQSNGDQCLEGFYIDQYEVTNAQYVTFLTATGGNQGADQVEYSRGGRINESGTTWTIESGYESHPVIEVTWYGARDYCRWRGGDLPTEVQWEYASRGPSGNLFPWGNEWNANNAVWSGNSGSSTAKVGSLESGRSWVGAYDLSGNVWEWILDEAYPYDIATININGGNYRVLRGGSWTNVNTIYLRSSSRFSFTPVITFNHFGFRCARS